MVETVLKGIKNFYDGFEVGDYVIMPNHIHFVLFKASENKLFINDVIGRFKSYTSNKCAEDLWQRSFYDHIIRNEKDYEEISKYIYDNPARWIYDDLH